jgi:hypothetical protein
MPRYRRVRLILLQSADRCCCRDEQIASQQRGSPSTLATPATRSPSASFSLSAGDSQADVREEDPYASLPELDIFMQGYPSTPHLPFSPQVHTCSGFRIVLIACCLRQVNADDIKLSSAASAHFANQQVVITEKLDGGNCCLYAGVC